MTVERLEDRAVPASFTAATVAELIANIDAANLTPEADKITLVAGATYTLTQVNNTTHGPTGLPTIANNLTIDGNGAILERSSAVETAAFRLFDVAAEASLTLKNLTLRGGLAAGPFGYVGATQGGAIFNQGTLVLDGVTVQNNTARGYPGSPIGFGGFVGPSDGMGGGVYSSGVLTMTGSTLQNNTAIGGRGLNALRAGPPVVIQAGPPGLPTVGGPGGNGLGGGLYLAGGTATICDSTIVDSTAKGGAGGNGFIKQSGKGTAAGPGGDGLGGGMYAAAGAVTLQRVTANGNHAEAGLGGVSAANKPPGDAGKGVGGGLYFAPAASAWLDAFTVNHVKHNTASNKHKNIHGEFNQIS